MELSTFGGILNFALELERRTLEFYRQAVTTAIAQPELQEQLRRLLADSERALRRLERVRRENINEMLLERISGLKEDDYQLPFEPSFSAQSEILASARRLEELAHRFYRDAAARINLPDVARVFTRLAADKAEHLALLAER